MSMLAFVTIFICKCYVNGNAHQFAWVLTVIRLNATRRFVPTFGMLGSNWIRNSCARMWCCIPRTASRRGQFSFPHTIGRCIWHDERPTMAA